MTTPYDPTLFRGTAAHYLRGRPSYARDLTAFLAAEADLTDRRALDIGCGPGTVVVELAAYAAEVVGLDPDAEMLAEATRYAERRGVQNVRWVRGRAEDLPALGLGRFGLVTFAQSFHWTDREAVAQVVYDILDPGGVLALVSHMVEGVRSQRGPPAHPGSRTNASGRSSLATSARSDGRARAQRPDRPNVSKTSWHARASDALGRSISKAAPTSSSQSRTYSRTSIQCPTPLRPSSATG